MALWQLFISIELSARPIFEHDKNVFQMRLANRKIEFNVAPETVWENFCENKEMGCARILIKTNEKKPDFGFIKSITSKIPKETFENYCRQVFTLSQKFESGLTGFHFKEDINMSYCKWITSSDVVYFFWKNNTTFTATATYKNFEFVELFIEAKTI